MPVDFCASVRTVLKNKAGSASPYQVLTGVICLNLVTCTVAVSCCSPISVSVFHKFTAELLSESSNEQPAAAQETGNPIAADDVLAKTNTDDYVSMEGNLRIDEQKEEL